MNWQSAAPSCDYEGERQVIGNAQSIAPRVLRGDRCQCGACGFYFNSTKAFDRHRRGTPGKDRRCRTVEEMTKAGMAQNAKGFWVTALGGPLHIRGNSRNGDRPADKQNTAFGSAPPTESKSQADAYASP